MNTRRASVGDRVFPAATRRLPLAAMNVLLAPVVLVQGRRTVRRTPRLDPASGPDRGTAAGSGPALHLMVIGESTAVGVGAVQHTEALPGFLANGVRNRLDRTVRWSVCGRRGATARKLISEVLPTLPYGVPDLVVLTIGINDLIRRRPLDRWTADLTELIATLRGRFGHAHLLVAGMPPVQRFVAFPQPLRFVLGARARGMDRILREVAVAHGATYVPMDQSFAGDHRMFAADGFHPSPAGYRTWADQLAEAV